MTSTLKKCPRCLFDSDIAEIGEAQCNYCDLHDTLEAQSDPSELWPALQKIAAHKGKYNCIMGISGGLDSSVLLYTAVREWGLRPLVVHFDNGWNNKIAQQNMIGLIETLDVDVINYRVNHSEYKKLNEAFLKAGVPDADIPNDIAMTKLMYQAADQHGIKWILNGHDFRTEGSTPAKWTYMDAKYIQDVYKKQTGKSLKNYPLFTFKDQVLYALKGIKQVRPFHYGFDRKKMESRMIAICGWKSYGGKHCENIYTEFVGSYLLPTKFGIDKRRVYLSARIRSGTLTKETALAMLENPARFNFDQFGEYAERLMDLSKSKKTDRRFYDHYDFKKWRFVIWILAKMKVVPFTFYKKYCF
jgi:hypothetical protein